MRVKMDFMKPDPDYLKTLLAAFRDAPAPTTDINKLSNAGLPTNTDEFWFHLRLLNDRGFVKREDDEPGVGLERGGLGDDDYVCSVVPLRLTDSGHEFAEAMNNSKVFAAVRKSFVGSSLAIMRDIAVAALKAEITKHGL